MEVLRGIKRDQPDILKLSRDDSIFRICDLQTIYILVDFIDQLHYFELGPTSVREIVKIYSNVTFETLLSGIEPMFFFSVSGDCLQLGVAS